MPSGPDIRPTQDMTRKAVFDILGSEIRGRRFLDLFAGTGANGIEALSRGAGHATFVEKSRFCIEAIYRNLRNTHLVENATVIRRDVLDFLQRKRPGECVFDIVFADPPYEGQIANRTIKTRDERSSSRTTRQPEPLAKRTLHLISAGNILSSGALVVIEHSGKTHLPEEESILVEWKARRYGSTMISIYRTA